MAEYASEQTLQDLLATAQAMNENLKKMSATLGKSPSGTPSAAAANESKSLVDKLTSGFSKLLPTMGILGKVFSAVATAVELVWKAFTGLLGGIVSLVGKLGDAAGILLNFAMAASKGTLKLSDMVGVMGDLVDTFLGDIPVIGTLMKGFSGFMKFTMERQEENLETYRKLTQVGGAFAGELGKLRDDTRNTGLTTQQFQAVLEKNSQSLAMFNGSAVAGIDAFRKLLHGVIDEGSSTSKQLFALGYTAQEGADLLATYLASQGSMTKRQLADQNTINAGVVGLAQEMTFLSEMTGKRREQVEKEVKDAQEDANWQNYLAGLDEKTRDKYNKAYNERVMIEGKAAGDMLKTYLRTGIVAPLNDAQRMLVTQTGGAIYDTTQQLGDAAKKGGESYVDAMVHSAYTNSKATQNFRDALGPTIAFLEGQGKTLTTTEQTQLATRLKNAKSEADYREIVLKALKHAKDGNKAAAELAEQQQRLADFGKMIDKLLSAITDPFIEPLMKMSGGFMKLVENLTKVIAPYLEQFATWVGGWVNKFTKVDSWDSFVKTSLSFWNDIKEKSVPLLTQLWESVRPILADAFKSIVDVFIAALRGNSWFARIFFSKTDTEKKEESEKERKYLVDAIAKEKQTGKHIAESEDDDRNLAQSLAEKTAKLNKMGYDEKGNRIAATQSTTTDKTTGSKTQAAPGFDAHSAKNISDWAFAIMTNQTKGKSLPADIKTDVDKLVSHPDDSLKKRVDAYKASVAQKAADAKAQADKEAAEKSKQKEDAARYPDEQDTPTVQSTSQDSSDTTQKALNSSIDQLVRLMSKTADNTADTVRAIGNLDSDLFRRTI